MSKLADSEENQKDVRRCDQIQIRSKNNGSALDEYFASFLHALGFQFS